MSPNPYLGTTFRKDSAATLAPPKPQGASKHPQDPQPCTGVTGTLPHCLLLSVGLIHSVAPHQQLGGTEGTGSHAQPQLCLPGVFSPQPRGFRSCLYSCAAAPGPLRGRLETGVMRKWVSQPSCSQRDRPPTLPLPQGMLPLAAARPPVGMGFTTFFGWGLRGMLGTSVVSQSSTWSEQ